METPKKVNEFTQTVLHELMARLIQPFVNWLMRWGFDPDHFTWASVGCAVVSAYSMCAGRWLDAGLWLLANGLCDVIDGVLARAMPERSRRLRERGVFLDPAIDRVNDGMLFVGLLCYGYQYSVARPGLQSDGLIYFFAALMAAAIAHPISSYFRAKIESLNMRFKQKKPLTRAGFHVALTLVIIGMWKDPSWELYLWGVTLLISVPTIGNMIYRFHRALHLFDEQNL